MTNDVSELLRDQNALIENQNRLLSTLAERLPSKASRLRGIGKTVLWVILTFTAILPAFYFGREIRSGFRQRESFRLLLATGDEHLSAGHPEQALQRFNEALLLFPGDPEGVVKKTQANARHLTEKYEDISRSLTGEEKKEIEGLVSDCMVLVRLRPEDSEAFRLLGLALQLAKRWEESIAALNTSLRLKPGNHEAYNQLGVTYWKKGDSGKAKELFTLAIQTSSADGTDAKALKALNNRGVVLLEEKKYSEAEADFEKAIAINNSYVSTYQNRGKLYLERALSLPEAEGEEKVVLFAKAMEDLLRVLVSNPQASGANYNLATVFYHTGHWSMALLFYEKADKLEPNDPLIHENKGVTLARMGRHEEAVRELSAAIDLAPAKISAYENRAKLYQLLKQPQRAVEDQVMAALLRGIEKAKDNRRVESPAGVGKS